MRKAISFSGQSRFVKEGLKSFRENLHNFEEYDVFIHTWADPRNEECYLYNPVSMVIEPQKNVVPKNVAEYTNSHFVHFSMFYSMKESLRLKTEWEEKNNFKYDLVIRTRFDLELATYLAPEYHELKGVVNSPDVCVNPLVISDWLNYSDSNTIDLYKDIYDNILNYYKEGVMITSGEELITHMLKTNNIKWNRIPCRLFLLRDRSIHPALSPNWKYAN